MPQTTTQTIEASKARKGDILVHKNHDCEITETSTKTKYTYITLNLAGSFETISYLPDDEIQVTRTEATPEEREAEKRMYANQLHASTAQRAGEELAKVQAKITENFGKGYSIDWSDLNDLISAQENLKLWKQIETVMENEPDADWVSAYDKVKERCTEELVHNYMRGSSSDEFSNAITAKKREVYSRMVTSYLW